jgi:hypothetical protein
MSDTPVFSTPMGDRALGRDTATTVAHWDRIIASIPTAPRIFGAAPVPRKSPNIRRFFYETFRDQRSRGFCVGFNYSGTLMTRLRIPDDATDTTGDPLPEISLSANYAYDVSRIQARAEGINLGRGDGSIGSCALRGSQRLGCVEEDQYPSDAAHLDRHANDAIPPDAVQAFGIQHLVKDSALADSFEHGLELNAGGHPLNVASAIPQGMMQGDAKGFFRMTGGVVGGHDYQLVDHDKDLNLAWIAQCWRNWGEQSGDPRYARRFGFTQLGTCPLDELARWFTPAMMANGESEMMVANVVEGFDPPIPSYSEWD